ncbi:hypothetical protein HPB48_011024 [Haemaphysalis longicornis]|uniref:Uncharacterized protein n=1 Tax=Haemaphysalis longicornis TaxID=44386 RepID=A0A9J6GUK4_HAELO|nr:hypothetical protein HPB48_011024 [Haemaphysalis longicornis]
MEGHAARDCVCPTKAKMLLQVRERTEHKVRKPARDSKATKITAPPDIANNTAFPSVESKIKPTAPVQKRIQPVCDTEVKIESSTEMSEQSAAYTSTTASRKQVSRSNRLPRRSRQPHMPDSINILRKDIASQRRHLQSLQKQLQKQLDLALKMENEDQTSQSLQECSPCQTHTTHRAAASGFPRNDVPTLPTPWSNDHYPIWIKLSGIWQEVSETRALHELAAFQIPSYPDDRTRRTRQTFPELIHRILRAAEAPTSISEVEGDFPLPEYHLVTLWKHRDELDETYIAGGRTYHGLVKIRQQTAKIRRHSKQLARQRWEEYREHFSRHTGVEKLWSTFRSLCGRGKVQGTVQADDAPHRDG